MKIALVGYGKMGKTIERIAIERGHTISHRIDLNNAATLADITPDTTDVAIEFTSPESALANLRTLTDNCVPTVCGSTGWLEAYDEIKDSVLDRGGAFIYASNYSIGVNVTFAVNQYLARLMSKHPSYKAHVHEVHHTSKVDAPSGTAITLAEGIIDNNDQVSSWTKGPSDDAGTVPITSDRIDPAPGTHDINYVSDIDTISLTHTAHSRQGFALGAVMAAEYLHSKTGVYTMQDVLSIH
jgi:4-hydroxy-tetrahydrodipicolinate reductase